MVRQTGLPFKRQRTDAQITARSGLTLYAECMQAMGFETLLDQHLCPSPALAEG